MCRSLPESSRHGPSIVLRPPLQNRRSHERLGEKGRRTDYASQLSVLVVRYCGELRRIGSTSGDSTTDGIIIDISRLTLSPHPKEIRKQRSAADIKLGYVVFIELRP